MRKLWFLALAAAFCGCHQKETNQPTAALTAAQPAHAAPPAAPRDSRPLIACFGDSLTAGLGLDPAQSYPALLQRDVDSHGYRYRVVNMGVSGDTTQDGLERAGMVAADRPAVVIVEFGANDGLRGQPVPHIQSNLSQMIETFQKAGIEVLLAGITLPPNYGPEYIQRFDAMYRSVAAQHKVRMIPFLLVNVAGHPDLMQRDGLHPNAAGARIVAGTVWKALEPMLSAVK